MHELASWKEEKRSAYLYRIISDEESGTARQLLFLELAKEADNQAELWAVEARATSTTSCSILGPTPTWMPSLRAPTRSKQQLPACSVAWPKMMNSISSSWPG